MIPPSAPFSGPDGSVESPPAWLADTRLPLETYPQGTEFFRIHLKSFQPIFYGPKDRSKPTYRYDSPTGAFGVIYMAPYLDGAVIETLLRSPQQRMIPLADIGKRAMSKLSADRALRLVKAHGQHLSMIGATSALFAGPYKHCRQWSDAFFWHPDEPDGLLYPSRHNPDALCIALFESSDVSLTAQSTAPLRDVRQVLKILDQHGKSVSIPPF